MERGRCIGLSMVMPTRVRCRKECHTGKEYTHTAQGHRRVDSGWEADSMDLASFTKLMVRTMREILRTTRRMVLEYLFLPTIMVATKENGRIIALMERER